MNSGPPVPQTGALTGLRYAPLPYQRTSTLMSPGMQGPPPAKGGRPAWPATRAPIGAHPRGDQETELWIIDQVCSDRCAFHMLKSARGAWKQQSGRMPVGPRRKAASDRHRILDGHAGNDGKLAGSCNFS